MKILVINTGSSSIKYELFDMLTEQVIANGKVERIGEPQSSLIYRYALDKSRTHEKNETASFADHACGLKRVAQVLLDDQCGSIKDVSEIVAVGHRVVHGGEFFKSSVCIDENVIAAIRENIPLAPLHNPANLKGIEVARAIFPSAYHVAVFDTAFHQTIPQKAFLYALPIIFYKNNKVRRYGFHGTSHSYIAEQAAKYLSKSLSDLNMITIHLGNGCSMAAIKEGQCVDTSMGMTPLEGLVMGTRSGDIDPAIIFYLADELKMSFDNIYQLLNKESGLKGLCGENDLREVMKKYDAGNNDAQMALEVYTYRLKKYVGSYLAVLGRCHCIVFTGGIGENNALIRSMALSGLEQLGVMLDESKNTSDVKGLRDIGLEGSPVKLFIIPTNEELKIARATRQVVESILAQKTP